MLDEVVITGMGIISPIGCDEPTFWDALRTGRSGAAEVEGFDVSELPRRIACQVRDPLKPASGDPNMGRASQLAIVASHQALVSARVAADQLAGQRVSVVIGTTMGETQFIEERLGSSDEQWLSPDHVQRIAAGRPGCISRNVQQHLQVGGAAVDLYGACAAGNMALASARRQLLTGQCDIALAGGVDGFSPLAFIGFMRARVLADGVCRPFDEKRDGLLVGEGAVMFTLERASSAGKRGATVRARITGDAVTCEDYHPTRPQPEGDGLMRATLEALRDAGLSSTDIGYVCAHGTGTWQNDAIEVLVMEKCFPRGVSFSSVKALTGHTMGAAGALEAACCVLSLEHQTMIPTWHLANVLEPCKLDAVKDAVRPAKLVHVLNNSAGFGGYNASLVLSAA